MNAATQRCFQWEQDGAGGDNGLVTFKFLEGDVSVRMYSFAEAFALQQAIVKAIFEARYDGRVSMLNQISRTQP